LGVETERCDAASAQGVAEDEVEGVDAGYVVAVDPAHAVHLRESATTHSVGHPVRHYFGGELMAQQREKIWVARANADVCVCAFVAASSVGDCNEWLKPIARDEVAS